MWASVVNRDGVVCAVAFTGGNRGDQWPGSRVISAQKANTANAFSLPGLALSTANLYSAVQPGGSLFGLQESNPVNTDVAYGGNPAHYGQAERSDGRRPHRRRQRVRRRARALQRAAARWSARIGVSGDSSCADHNIAWRDAQHAEPRLRARRRERRCRRAPDNIVYDITPQAGQMPGVSAGGWGHPACSAAATAIAAALPVTE